MKKALLIIFGLLVLAGFVKPALAQSIGFRIEPSSGGKVDDPNPIKIFVEISNPPTGSKLISLYISDTIPKNIEEATPYFKKSWPDIPDQGATKTYLYEWDTKAAGSNPGLHYINVFITDAANYVLLNNTTQYTLLAADSTGAETETGTGAEAETGTGTGTAGSGTIGFDLGKLGKVSFLPTKVNDAEELIYVIVNWLLSLMGALAVIAIVYSGIMYITAGSDTAKAEAAKKNLTWAIIGIVIVLLALVIVTFVNKVISG